MATTDIYTYLHTLSRHDALPIWGVLSFAYFALHKQRKRKRLWSFRRRAAARNQKPDRAKTPVLRAALSPCALLNDSMSFSRAKRLSRKRERAKTKRGPVAVRIRSPPTPPAARLLP